MCDSKSDCDNTTVVRLSRRALIIVASRGRRGVRNRLINPKTNTNRHIWMSINPCKSTAGLGLGEGASCLIQLPRDYPSQQRLRLVSDSNTGLEERRRKKTAYGRKTMSFSKQGLGEGSVSTVKTAPIFIISSIFLRSMPLCNVTLQWCGSHLDGKATTDTHTCGALNGSKTRRRVGWMISSMNWSLIKIFFIFSLDDDSWGEAKTVWLGGRSCCAALLLG